MITDHPFLDNNGPTYVGGVCRNLNADDALCDQRASEHLERVTQKRSYAKRFVIQGYDETTRRELTPHEKERIKKAWKVRLK